MRPANPSWCGRLRWRRHLRCAPATCCPPAPARPGRPRDYARRSRGATSYDIASIDELHAGIRSSVVSTACNGAIPARSTTGMVSSPRRRSAAARRHRRSRSGKFCSLSTWSRAFWRSARLDRRSRRPSPTLAGCLRPPIRQRMVPRRGSSAARRCGRPLGREHCAACSVQLWHVDNCKKLMPVLPIASAQARRAVSPCEIRKLSMGRP